MSLNHLRKEIDLIDDEILNLFLKRLGLCRKIGEIKLEKGILIEDLDREKYILNKMKKAAGEESPAAEKLFKEVIKICKNIQGRT